MAWTELRPLIRGGATEVAEVWAAVEAIADPLLALLHASLGGRGDADAMRWVAERLVARVMAEGGLPPPEDGESAACWLGALANELAQEWQAERSNHSGDATLLHRLARRWQALDRADLPPTEVLYLLALHRPEELVRDHVVRAVAWRPGVSSARPGRPVLYRPVDETWVLLQEWRDAHPASRSPEALAELAWICGAGTEESPEEWEGVHPDAALLSREAVTDGATAAALVLCAAREGGGFAGG